eukprot:8288739-Alexandrium_andersonii.AAC.1
MSRAGHGPTDFLRRRRAEALGLVRRQARHPTLDAVEGLAAVLRDLGGLLEVAQRRGNLQRPQLDLAGGAEQELPDRLLGKVVRDEALCQRGEPRSCQPTLQLAVAGGQDRRSLGKDAVDEGVHCLEAVGDAEGGADLQAKGRQAQTRAKSHLMLDGGLQHQTPLRGQSTH